MHKRSKMMRFGLSLAPVFLLAAVAQAAPSTVYFWNSSIGSAGARAGVSNAKVGKWGNGEFAESRTVQYEGANTLKVVPRGFREGIRFDLNTPLDITPYRESGYLRFRLHFRDTRNTLPAAGGFPGMPELEAPDAAPAAPTRGFGGGFQGNFQIAPLPPLGAMGGFAGLPGMGGEGGMAVPQGPIPQETPITQLLCTFVLENGIMEGTIDIPKEWRNPRRIDLDKVRPDANGWLMLTLPLKQMRSTPNASGALQRLIFSADRQDSFWLTQAALVVETGEIQVSIRKLNDPPGTQVADITVRPGPITLVADVESGAADPAIEWNFDADNVGNLPWPGAPAMPAPGAVPGLDPAAGVPFDPAMPGGVMPGGEQVAPVPLGPRIDARGLVAKFEYPNEEQNYRVEVTVRDRTGKKEPATASILVRVRG